MWGMIIAKKILKMADNAKILQKTAILVRMTCTYIVPCVTLPPRMSAGGVATFTLYSGF